MGLQVALDLLCANARLHSMELRHIAAVAATKSRVLVQAARLRVLVARGAVWEGAEAPAAEVLEAAKGLGNSTR